MQAVSTDMAAAFIGAFVLGGIVKGATGIAFPLVTVPILATVMPVPQAAAIMVVPMFASNVLQATQGSRFLPTLRRFAPMLGMLTIGIVLGSHLLLTLNPQQATFFLGATVLLFAGINVFSPEWRIRPSVDRWLGPLAGFCSGVIGGITSFWGPLAISYMVALRLQVQEFVPAVSLIGLVGGAALYGTFAIRGILALPELGASAVALLPMLVGLKVGYELRNRMVAATFRWILVALLVVVGLNLIRKALI